MGFSKNPKIRLQADDEVRVTGPEPHNPFRFCMTSDRPCISERGMMVHAGTKVTYVAHVGAQAVKCKMEDGSEEILHPHCFPELR